MTEGTDITLIGTSTMLDTTMKVCHELQLKDISVQTLSMHTIKPIDAASICEAVDRTNILLPLKNMVLWEAWEAL